MALNTFKRNYLTPLHYKGLNKWCHTISSKRNLLLQTVDKHRQIGTEIVRIMAAIAGYLPAPGNSHPPVAWVTFIDIVHKWEVCQLWFYVALHNRFYIEHSDTVYVVDLVHPFQIWIRLDAKCQDPDGMQKFWIRCSSITALICEQV